MAAGIQRLSRQALVTFMTRETAAFSSNFERLKTMLDSITAEDIKLAVPNHIEQSNGSYTGAPATHVSIFECPFFSLGVFILKKGSSIPLHDHPGMFGLCKVVYGKISVESYQRQSETSLNGRTDGFSRHPLHGRRRRLIKCRKTTQSFEETSQSCVLTPTAGNHHAIHNISLGPSAFVDILGPPYAQDKGRDCTYYQECDPPAYQDEGSALQELVGPIPNYVKKIQNGKHVNKGKMHRIIISLGPCGKLG
ncbi:2-aminoethanethiol dioxygenase-like isoform X3 [Orbicella faveolata]|uniref:2-aminoethanethiol dioxygenase-like isoform X3 n=1 Tax=Orbicella faveolata TaxID=48498 RepID=UPI0009E59B63|nr:2-aminoethanethiol dioxygenase-like isoform X3 [Orbicella faveolata]